MRYQLESAGSSPEALHVIDRPLFGTPIDYETQGGLVVLDTGQVAEVTALEYIPEGGDTSLNGNRVKPQPFWVSGDRIVWVGKDYDPAAPSVGVEIELSAMDEHARWHELSADGENLTYPDGSTEPGANQGHALESLSYTHECGSEAPFPRGYDDFRRQTDQLKAEKRAWLQSRGLTSPPVSGFPEMLTPSHATDHPITRMLQEPHALPKFLEFSFSMSEQLNIQMRDPDAALFAINAYQALQPMLNVVTASAPVRDGSIDTTLRDHYEDNRGYAQAATAAHYRRMGETVQREMPKKVNPYTGAVSDFFDEIPYDWRQLARAYGSRSGGIIAKGTPLTVEEFLREGDRQLRSGENMTLDRTLGWHTDRLRPGKGVIEVCNLSHAGQHPDKIAAVEETVIKAMVALQEYFNDPHTYKEEWAGIIPQPHEINDRHARQQLVNVAQANSAITALYGKERRLYDTEWQERTLQEYFEAFFDFANTYSPEPISDATYDEMIATLDQPVPAGVFEGLDAGEVFRYFYTPGSRMTAAEALRTAHEVSPEIPVGRLLFEMGKAADEANRHYGEMCLEASGVAIETSVV